MTQRIYVDTSLSIDQSVEVSADQAHYLGHVLRLENGAYVHVFNGRDGEWRALLQISKRTVSLHIQEQIRPQPPTPSPAVILMVAPCKRQDWVVEKATELGVHHIFPVMTQHTVVRHINQEKWQRWAIEAAEQSERLDVPVIHEVQSLQTVLGTWSPTQPIYWCAERLNVPLLWQKLPEHPHDKPITLLIGPEGGFSTTEAEILCSYSAAMPVSLGPQILRVETAVIMGLSVIRVAGVS